MHMNYTVQHFLDGLASIAQPGFETEKILFNTDFLEFRSDNDETLLHFAVRQGLEKGIAFLLQNEKWKKFVNAKNDIGETPLHVLCQNSANFENQNGGRERIEDILKALLENGANINISDDSGWTPLHDALHAESVFMTEKLLAIDGIDANKQVYFQGATPLHMAVDRNMLRTTRSLIAKGANCELTTHSGETVLHWALMAAKLIDGDDGLGVDDGDPINNYLVIGSEDYGEDYGAMIGQNQKSPQGTIVNRENKDDQDDYETDDKERMDAILKILTGEDRLFQLLQVAYREPDLDMVKFAFHKLQPGNSWTVIYRLWMAMSEDRLGDLEKELQEEVKSKAGGPPRSWNVLDLSAYLGIPQIVRWLLRSKRWKISEKVHAKSLVRDRGRTHGLGTDGSIWDEPFVKYNGTERNRDGFMPDSRDTDKDLSKEFQSTIVDLYNEKNQFGMLCHSRKVHELLYSGEGKGLKPGAESVVELLAQKMPGFAKNTYGPSSFRFRWIHLHANSIQWTTDAATVTYQAKYHKVDEIKKRLQFLENSWHELPESGSGGKYMHPNCSRKAFHRVRNNQETNKTEEAINQLALYVPYIKCAPQPHKVEDILDDDEHTQSEDFKLPFHRSRTLDMYYRGRSEAVTDEDQVVSRFMGLRNGVGSTGPESTKREREGKQTSEILHVGQLWLWVIDEKTIITGTTHYPRADTDPMFEGILDRLSDSDNSFNREAVLASTDSFVKFIFNFYVNIVDNLTLDVNFADSDEEQSESYLVDEIFASSIERVSKQESDLRKKFRDQIGDVPIEGEDEIHKDVSKATELLTEIQDIRGELKMIRSVVRTQQRVWNQLSNQPTGYSEDSDGKQNDNSGKGTDPSYVLDRIQGLLEFAEEVEKNVESVLELRMNHLNLHEAENTRKQGETLMVFTVVTIIFTPLSFVTSLFAVNISVFPHSGDNVLFPPGLVFGILVGVLVGFSLIVWIVVKVSKTEVRQRLLGKNIKVLKKDRPNDPSTPMIHAAEQQLSNKIRRSSSVLGGWIESSLQWRRNRVKATERLPT
ncbi:uncharacterized protein F4822DRAFT_403525 [Hypoxylon trugodes]|uniref:uncharacterized protein n=1 Tax=Hypoxylon trugodes TaxID=326681 RepID=UPI0021A0D894|nr:uncharacterized protein F4822DRAFT_403525 [Hypoxylon trugodes]KAI1388674.1 hypothetical protein F4822DRAFT_403525 [Hypoxylon trugodes]